MRFCQKEGGCQYNLPVQGTDRNTNIGYCRYHQTLRTDISKKSITQRAIEKHKANPTTKIVKEPRFKRPGRFIQPLNEDGLNSEIVFVTPTPECFDGKRVDVGSMDEMGMWDESKGVDESIANLTTDLDQVLSLVVRYKYARPDGMVKCFCCPFVLPIKEAHNSHYIKRGNRATRFLESNCRPSCPQCNQDHNYDEIPYTNALEAEQPGLAAELKELGKITYKANRSELKEQLIELRSRLEILKLKIPTDGSNK